MRTRTLLLLWAFYLFGVFSYVHLAFFTNFTVRTTPLGAVVWCLLGAFMTAMAGLFTLSVMGRFLRWMRQ